MATLESFVDKLPQWCRNRYLTSGKFVDWLNEMLEDLQERSFLPITIKETGAVVNDGFWIDKPSDLLFLEKVYHPKDERIKFRVSDVNNKFKLMDAEFNEEDSDEQITSASFDGYDVDEINCVDLTDTDYIEDYFKGWLFLITAGTMAGVGLVVSGNDQADGTGTRLDFLHAQSAALDGTKVTAARLVNPNYYVMLKYKSVITAISIIGDEVPVDDDCEKRLVPAYLRWCCEREATAIGKETAYWGQRVIDILGSIQAARLSRPMTPAKGRRLVGYEKREFPAIKDHPDYSEFT
jgi:hypothetical protein